MKLEEAFAATGHARRPIYDAETMRTRADIAKYMHKDNEGFSMRWSNGVLIGKPTEGTHLEHIEDKDDWEAV